MLEKYEHKQLMCGEGKSLIFSSDISVICQPLWGTYKPVQICGQSHLRMVTVYRLVLSEKRHRDAVSDSYGIR